jgi:signal transduction histidine kinase
MPKPKIKIQYRFVTKLLISHILLASIPIILTGFVLIKTARKTVEQNFKDRIIELARHSEKIITMVWENAEKIVELNTSNILNIYGNRITQELLINEIINEFHIFKDVKLLDDSGYVVISTSFIEDSTRYSDNELLNAIRSNTEYQSEVFLSEDKLPLIKIAKPILKLEELIGILVAEVNLKEMWDLIESSVVGEGAQAFVFDNSGRYIAHSERKRVYLGEKFQEPEIFNKIALEDENQILYFNKEGIEMVAAYVSISKLGWWVVIQQPTQKAFAVAYKMKILILWLVVLSILLSSFIAFLYTRWIVTPVNQLISGMDKFSSGNLKYRMPNLGRDEISTLAEQFNEMAEKLTIFQEKLKRGERAETLSKLASVLSHEIKNPLNAMVINMRIIEREFKQQSPQIDKMRHYLEIVAGEIPRVDNLVNDFLLVARPQRLVRKPTDIKKLLDDLIISQQADALQSGVRVLRRYQKSHLEILIDETKIRQVILNIYLNAVQSMSGGGNLTIELDSVTSYINSNEQQGVVIKFSDNGKGMTKEQLNRIFDFYYSTKEGGTGLGLSIAQQIVEEHGGRIDVTSSQTSGSTFLVFLPQN